jgi:hypothetical protein
VSHHRLECSTCPSSRERTRSHSEQTTQSRQHAELLWRLSARLPTEVGLRGLATQKGRRYGEEKRTRWIVSVHLQSRLSVAAMAGSESYATTDGGMGAELRRTWDGRSAMGRVVRTFLDALEQSIVDCRELKGTNWAGRSPLLGSIVRCRPKSMVKLDYSIFFYRARAPDTHLDQKRTFTTITVHASSPPRAYFRLCLGAISWLIHSSNIENTRNTFTHHTCWVLKPCGTHHSTITPTIMQ